MTIRPPILDITCDGCGDTFLKEATEISDDPVVWDARHAISSAKEDGWLVTPDGEAHCPRCLDSLTKE